MDALYSFDENALKSVRNDKPWTRDVKYFKKVKISPSATMKMLMHSVSGVENGIKKGGKPVEVMGMILGRPDFEPGSLIVTDVYPLPIEGAETRVLADDHEVTNFMIDLGEHLEATRSEKFMGWYHSHPFEVEGYSHCFLSSTDIATQLLWQNAEDPHGNPWLAIVVDPLRSLAKEKPEFGAFRAYPPDYSAPDEETPDGKTLGDDTKRVERWGTCWNRYCSLEIEYFMSSLAADVMKKLTEKFLWMKEISSSQAVLEKEMLGEASEQMSEAKKLLNSYLKGHPKKFSHALETAKEKSKGASKGETALKKGTKMTNDVARKLCEAQISRSLKSEIYVGSEGIANEKISEENFDPMEVASHSK